MKKALIFGICVGLFSGCASIIDSFITTQKAPFSDLKGDKCFNLPSKEAMKQMPISKQTLYIMTKDALENHNIAVYYGEPNKCGNVLMTGIEIGIRNAEKTQKGMTITNNYGNAYGYGNRVYGGSTSYSYNMPDITYDVVKADYNYFLIVGEFNEKGEFIEAWRGNFGITGEVDSAAEAEKLEEDDRIIINRMVERMLEENNLVIK